MPSKRTKRRARPVTELVQIVASKLRPPIGVVLGSPGEVLELMGALPAGEIVSYQMDLFQANRLREALRIRGHDADVVTYPDLWDLPQPAETLVYPVAHGGERVLKLDMIEQAYHALKPHGTLIVLSPYEADDFFARALKKVFGKVHVPMEGANTVFWCQREGDRPRRRHEMTYHVRVDENTSYAFVARPGVFGYGFFDEGARALVEAIELKPGQRLLDLGCGVGTNGILAARQLGPDGAVVFADSNARAVALAELNARELGVPRFETQATCTLTDWPDASFDVVLANPPYYAQGSIMALFVERSHALLKAGGTLYLVTKQIDAVLPIVQERFGDPELFENRGYLIVRATKPLAA